MRNTWVVSMLRHQDYIIEFAPNSPVPSSPPWQLIYIVSYFMMKSIKNVDIKWQYSWIHQTYLVHYVTVAGSDVYNHLDRISINPVSTPNNWQLLYLHYQQTHHLLSIWRSQWLFSNSWLWYRYYAPHRSWYATSIFAMPLTLTKSWFLTSRISPLSL